MLPGGPKLGWLNRSNTSTRNCSAAPAADTRVLHGRQIRVVEAGPDDGISAQIAEPVDGRERRRIEPLIRRTDDADRSDDDRDERCSAGR